MADDKDWLSEILLKLYYKGKDGESLPDTELNQYCEAIKDKIREAIGEDETPDKGGAKSRVVAIRNQLRAEIRKELGL